MRIYNNLFFLGLLFIAACNSNKVPDGIIPEKKMTNLLTDVHLVDGSLYSISQAPDTLYKHGMARYLDLFKRYGTDSTQFKKSMQYYTADLGKMETMYNQILENMTAKSDSLNKVRTKIDAAKTDSLQKIKKKELAHRTDSLNKLKKEIKK